MRPGSGPWGPRGHGCGDDERAGRLAEDQEPATATVVGVVVLTQVPTPAELAGVVLVVAGVALHRQAADPEAPPARRGTSGA